MRVSDVRSRSYGAWVAPHDPGWVYRTGAVRVSGNNPSRDCLKKGRKLLKCLFSTTERRKKASVTYSGSSQGFIGIPLRVLTLSCNL